MLQGCTESSASMQTRPRQDNECSSSSWSSLDAGLDVGLWLGMHAPAGLHATLGPSS